MKLQKTESFFYFRNNTVSESLDNTLLDEINNVKIPCN